MPRWRMPFAQIQNRVGPTHLHTNRVRCAKHARENNQAPATRGRGRGRGRGGGHHVRGGPAGHRARAPCPRGTVARRAAPARVAATLKTELKLTAVSDNAVDFDADEDWEADFNEDVFNAESSGASAHGSDEQDTVESEHDPDTHASDLDEGYDGYVEEQHQEDDDAAQGGAEEDAYALAPPLLKRCFQHWLLTMRALLRSVAACAALNPKAATPKQVSLMQLGESIVWFALEASQPPSKLEGRIVSLDNIGSVKYTLPGIRRANIIDVAPGIAAGSHRFLLHTRSEHIRPADLRIPIDDSTFMIN